MAYLRHLQFGIVCFALSASAQAAILTYEFNLAITSASQNGPDPINGIGSVAELPSELTVQFSVDEINIGFFGSLAEINYYESFSLVLGDYTYTNALTQFTPSSGVSLFTNTGGILDGIEQLEISENFIDNGVAVGDFFTINSWGAWGFTRFTDSPFDNWEINGTGPTNFTLVSTSTVPLPTAFWLFGSGLLGLIGAARSKKTFW